MIFWAEAGGKDADALQVQIDKFEQQENVEVEFLPVRDHARIVASISSGDTPDLIMTWDGYAVGSWGLDGSLRDLQPYIDQAKWDTSDFIPGLMGVCNLLGVKQIAIPFNNYLNSLFFWNKANFVTAGLDPEKPPTTWEETWELSQKLSIVNNGQLDTLGYLVTSSFENNPYGPPITRGGSLWSSDFRLVTPDSEENLEALRWKRKFYETYTTDEILRFADSNKGNSSDPAYPLYTGKSPMTLQGEWMPSFIGMLEPKPDIGMGWMPVPEAKTDMKNRLVAGANFMVVPTGAKEPDVAFKFMQFITEPENSAPMNNIIGNAAPTKEGIKLMAETATDPMYKKILTDFWPNADVRYRDYCIPIGPQYADAMNREVAAVLQDGKDELEAMQVVKAEIQPLLDDMLKKLGI
jgi:multiple sugar transport system substrate-binding protein